MGDDRGDKDINSKRKASKAFKNDLVLQHLHFTIDSTYI